MGRTRTNAHYLAILIGALALMCGYVAAQSLNLVIPDIFGADLPTVADDLDYARFKAPVFPSDLPTVPDFTSHVVASPELLASAHSEVPLHDVESPQKNASRAFDKSLVYANNTSAKAPPKESVVGLALSVRVTEHETEQSVAEQLEAGPLDGQLTVLTQPWWAEPQPVTDEIGITQAIELDRMIWLAIENSPYVRSLLVEPQILEARASATLGVFDPTPFVSSIFNDSSNPVGNTLATGGPPRLNENLWENGTGIKTKTQTGALTELNQEMNFHDSNSKFFLPHNQADTRMVMRYTQPLMRGAGTTYNRSSFVIASLATSESVYEVTNKIQQHAFVISTNYWELYYARSLFQQSVRGLERLTALRDQLAGRADLDSLRSQLMRADSQISRQRAQQARAAAQVAASEAKLRAAVGAPELKADSAGILIPTTAPADWKPNLDMQSELGLALTFHPNIRAVHARIKAATVKLKVAENELRPTLNLVMEGYARGLNGNYNLGSSLGDQFSQGAPSYSAGMTYQRPYRNLAAKAHMREMRLDMQKHILDLDNTLLTVSSELESEIESAQAAFIELESAVRSTLAAHAELEYLTGRWRNAFLDSSQNGTSLLLDQLLNANVQLIQAENAWARAQADHMLALARVRLASGSLLSVSGDSLPQ